MLLLISCGWAVRNYLRSSFLETMTSDANLTVMIPPGDRPFESELRRRAVQMEVFRNSVPSRTQSILMGLLVDATNDRLGFRDRYVEKRTAAYLTRLGRAYMYLRGIAGRWLGRTRMYEWARELEKRWIRASDAYAHYEKRLAHLQPDMVVSTHSYSWQEVCASLAATDMGIHTVCAILSWDHLSYRGHLVPEFTQYVVWGEMMKEDLRVHVPDVRDVDIFLSGAPQFDFHVREDLVWTRGDFFARIGGDPGRRLIAYSASPHREFPDEPNVVAQLWDQIQEGRVEGNPQLLVRLHPHDREPDRFDALSERCPGLVLMRPWPQEEGRHWWFTPDEEELALLSNTLRYADVNINMASSMTLDASVLGTPVVNVAFTTTPEDPRCQPILLAHHGCISYGRLTDSGAVRLAASLEELVRATNAYLRHPETDQRARQEVVRWVCGPVDGGASLRTAQFLLAGLYRGQEVSR